MRCSGDEKTSGDSSMDSTRKLRHSASSLVIATILSALTTTAAIAQAAAPGVEEVVVTGTSIRGTQPVGSNLISVGRVEIEKTSAQTVQQILKAVPALSNLGSPRKAAATPPPPSTIWARFPAIAP